MGTSPLIYATTPNNGLDPRLGLMPVTQGNAQGHTLYIPGFTTSQSGLSVPDSMPGLQSPFRMPGYVEPMPNRAAAQPQEVLQAAEQQIPSLEAQLFAAANTAYIAHITADPARMSGYLAGRGISARPIYDENLDRTVMFSDQDLFQQDIEARQGEQLYGKGSGTIETVSLRKLLARIEGGQELNYVDLHNLAEYVASSEQILQGPNKRTAQRFSTLLSQLEEDIFLQNRLGIMTRDEAVYAQLVNPESKLATRLRGAARAFKSYELGNNHGVGADLTSEQEQAISIAVQTLGALYSDIASGSSQSAYSAQIAVDMEKRLRAIAGSSQEFIEVLGLDDIVSAQPQTALLMSTPPTVVQPNLAKRVSTYFSGQWNNGSGWRRNLKRTGMVAGGVFGIGAIVGLGFLAVYTLSQLGGRGSGVASTPAVPTAGYLATVTATTTTAPPTAAASPTGTPTPVPSSTPVPATATSTLVPPTPTFIPVTATALPTGTPTPVPLSQIYIQSSYVFAPGAVANTGGLTGAFEYSPVTNPDMCLAAYLWDTGAQVPGSPLCANPQGQIQGSLNVPSGETGIFFLPSDNMGATLRGADLIDGHLAIQTIGSPFALNMEMMQVVDEHGLVHLVQRYVVNPALQASPAYAQTGDSPFVHGHPNFMARYFSLLQGTDGAGRGALQTIIDTINMPLPQQPQWFQATSRDGGRTFGLVTGYNFPGTEMFNMTLGFPIPDFGAGHAIPLQGLGILDYPTALGFDLETNAMAINGACIWRDAPIQQAGLMNHSPFYHEGPTVYNVLYLPGYPSGESAVHAGLQICGMPATPTPTRWLTPTNTQWITPTRVIITPTPLKTATQPVLITAEPTDPVDPTQRVDPTQPALPTAQQPTVPALP